MTQAEEEARKKNKIYSCSMLETSENYTGAKSSGAVLQVKQKGLIQICGFVPLHGSVLPKELHCRAHTQILSLGKNLHG